MDLSIPGINEAVMQAISILGPYSEYVYAVLIIVATGVAIKIASMLIGALQGIAKEKTESTIDEKVLEAVKRPIKLGILLFGVYVVLKSLSMLQESIGSIDTAFTVLFSFYFAYFASRIVGMVIELYSTEIAHKTKTKADEQFLPILKRAAYGVIFGIVIIIMLNQLGIRVETLIATLGIGGLAIALALQPTLANFFSGLQMVLDRPLRIGDYVELDSGDKGTVTDIGWRSTKIKTYMNNIVTIPNSKLSDSKIINYNTPTTEIGFAVDCGVAYDSDLELAEKVSVQVARDVMERCNGVKGFEPIFRYREFGDSSINFKVVMRTRSLADSYLAIHEFIKTLKRRFDQEGVEIAFPQMDVHFDKEHERGARRKVPKRKRR